MKGKGWHTCGGFADWREGEKNIFSFIFFFLWESEWREVRGNIWMQDEVGSTNVHFFSLTLTPVSPPFSSSLLRNYLLVVLPGNRRGKKGGNIDSSAYPVARQQQWHEKGRGKCFHHTLFGKRKTRTLAISGFVFTFPSLYLWQKHRNNFAHSLRCFSTERNKKIIISHLLCGKRTYDTHKWYNSVPLIKISPSSFLRSTVIKPPPPPTSFSPFSSWHPHSGQEEIWSWGGGWVGLQLG